MTCIDWKRARQDSDRSKTMCATVQIIPLFIKSKENRRGGEGVGGSRKTKHVPDELVKYISWKMTSLQSEGHVPVLDLRSLYELSCYHSTLSVPYYLEDQWRLYYISLLTPFREPSTAALLGPLITGGVFRTSYVFPEKSHKTDLAVILSYVFIEARSGASRAAQSDSGIYNMSCGNDRVAS